MVTIVAKSRMLAGHEATVAPEPRDATQGAEIAAIATTTRETWALRDLSGARFVASLRVGIGVVLRLAEFFAVFKLFVVFGFAGHRCVGGSVMILACVSFQRAGGVGIS